MHIAHVIGFLFLLKIREIFIFNIMFTAFIKNLPVGELMGLFNAFRSIGQVAGSMVSGFSYTVGHALPFFCASAFFMMMVFILRWGTSGERKRHANGGIKRRKKNG